MNEINISQVDALFSSGSYPIEFLFYYEKEFNTERIRSSLKSLSSDFWPLFGQYRDGIISFEKYTEEECYEEEVVSQEFNIPKTEEERLETYSRYGLPATGKLFFLKILRFKNGMVLVPKMSHLAGDGYSYFYFLSVLARLSQHSLFPFKSSLIKSLFKPHHRRTTLKNFSFKLVELEPWKQDRKFTIEFSEILRKNVYSTIKDISHSKNHQVSTNDVLSAMAVKKLSRVQNKFVGDSMELTIPIDVRRHVKEYGRRFFGNGLMLHMIKFRKDDIEYLPTDEIAVQIRKSMPSVSSQTYKEYLTRLEEILSEEKTEKFRPFDPGKGFLVTNISRLPVDKLDFGAGRPELIYPLTMDKNAAAILAKEENFILKYAY